MPHHYGRLPLYSRLLPLGELVSNGGSQPGADITFLDALITVIADLSTSTKRAAHDVALPFGGAQPSGRNCDIQFECP